MKFIINFIKFLVYSNIWIGLGAAAFTWQFYLINHLNENWRVIGFAFFATVLTYTFQRFIKIKNRAKGGNRLIWMKKNRSLVIAIMATAALGCFYTLYFFVPAAYFVLPISGLLSLFYIVKLPGRTKKSLRDIPSLKIFLIGLVWAATSTFLPYFNLVETDLEWPWLFFITNFLFVIAITIPFDIRDLEYDEAEKKTIPQLVGEQKALWISVVLLLINYPLLTLIADNPLIITLLSLSLGIILIRASHRNRDDLYFAFLIDGFLLLQPILIFLDMLTLKGVV